MTSSGRKMLRHATAMRLAERIRDELAPTCLRIVVAGSLRRAVPRVGDVELLAEPKLGANLFGEVDAEGIVELDRRVLELVDEGHLAVRGGNGPRYKALLATKTGIAVDLFVCRPPASWGALLAIRTGPAHFSQRLVTGLLRRGLRSTRAHVVDSVGRRVPTPTEREYFDACGVPWVEPSERG